MAPVTMRQMLEHDQEKAARPLAWVKCLFVITILSRIPENLKPDK